MSSSDTLDTMSWMIFALSIIMYKRENNPRGQSLIVIYNISSILSILHVIVDNELVDDGPLYNLYFFRVKV